MSDLTKQSELKELAPCPFCGSGARYEPSGRSPGYWVQCVDCHASTSDVGTPEKAAELWNTRPPSAGVRGLDWEGTFIDRGDGSSDQAGWEANNGFDSWYSIEQYFGSDSYGYQVKFDCDVIGDFDDPDQAKACAQKHFSARIRSALSDHGVQESAERSSDYERVGFQYLHYSPFTGHEVWLDKDFYNGHRATVTREIFARLQDTKSDGGVEGHAQRATSAATAPRLAASGMGGIEAPAAGIKPGPSDSLLSKTLSEGEKKSIATKQESSPESAPRTETAGAIYSALSSACIEHSALSVSGFNLFGDSKSIKAAQEWLHSHNQIGDLKTNLRHWRDECGKLHAKLTKTPSADHDAGNLRATGGEA